MSYQNTSNRSRSRNQTLAAIGGAAAVISLGVAAYAWYTSSSSSQQGRGRNGDAGGASSAANGNEDGWKNPQSHLGGLASAKLSSRPTMSLSLPPNFPRTPESMGLLASLMQELSEHYLIHLIIPTSSTLTPGSTPGGLKRSAHRAAPPPPLETDGGAAGNEGGRAVAGDDMDGVEASIASLSRSLAHVRHFDRRRILEYSKPEGRQAVARALACDAHLQVLLAVSTGLEDLEEVAEEKEIVGLEQLQKSCGVVVLLSLPLGRTTGASSAGIERSTRITKAFDGKPGFRVFDLTQTASSDDQTAWAEGAAYLVELRSGWR